MHLERRDRELATLHGQLDQLLYGSPDLFSSKSFKNPDSQSTDSIFGSADSRYALQTERDLEEQIIRLEQYLLGLRSERENLLFHDLVRPAPPDHNLTKKTSSESLEETSSLRAQLISQRRMFDEIAQRAQEKLVLQKQELDTVRKQFQDLRQELHDTEQVAREANMALKEETGRRQQAEAIIWSANPVGEPFTGQVSADLKTDL